MKQLALILTALSLGGCVTTGIQPQPTAAQLDTPDARQQVTAVDLSALQYCKAKQREHSAPWGPSAIGSDGIENWRKSDHDVSVANGRIIAANNCIDGVIASYSNKTNSEGK